MTNDELIPLITKNLADCGYTGQPGPYRSMEYNVRFNAHACDQHAIFTEIDGANSIVHTTSDINEHRRKLAQLNSEHLARCALLAVRAAEADVVRELTYALHEAITRPMGVVPASADPFYDAALAARIADEKARAFLNRTPVRSNTSF